MAANHNDLVLITGVSGHVGFAVLRQALRQGYNVRAVVRSEAKAKLVGENEALKGLKTVSPPILCIDTYHVLNSTTNQPRIHHHSRLPRPLRLHPRPQRRNIRHPRRLSPSRKRYRLARRRQRRRNRPARHPQHPHHPRNRPLSTQRPPHRHHLLQRRHHPLFRFPRTLRHSLLRISTLGRYPTSVPESLGRLHGVEDRCFESCGGVG